LTRSIAITMSSVTMIPPQPAPVCVAAAQIRRAPPAARSASAQSADPRVAVRSANGARSVMGNTPSRVDEAILTRSASEGPTSPANAWPPSMTLGRLLPFDPLMQRLPELSKIDPHGTVEPLPLADLLGQVFIEYGLRWTAAS
jgi:hypothetical protein